jgi:tetratricopeptide (TPR) repeat protein
VIKNWSAFILVLGGMVCTAGVAQTAAPALNPAVASIPEATPAEQRIGEARHELKSDPRKLEAYNELAIAYIRRARETADSRYLNDAEAALSEGLKLDSTDFQLLRTRTALLLSRHEHAKARDLALELNRRTPDDVMTYGYIAEADIALGNYPEAETNAQWMMNMRPNNTPALLVGAQLRVLYGDAHGAMDFLNRAYSQTSPIEVEDLAWIANQIAVIQIDTGENNAAEQILGQAEQLFPHYVYTMENLAQVRMAQHRPQDAILLWKQAAQMDRDPHALYELARAHEESGHTKDAQATYAEFEKLAKAKETTTERSTLDLILMYAGNATTSPDALIIAQKEAAARQDVDTLDAYAWALYANGKFQEADAAVQKELAVGIQNARIFDHAGHIAQSLNRAADAAKYFQLAVQSNPASEYTADARKSVGNSTMASDERQSPLQSTSEPASMRAAALSQSSMAADQKDGAMESAGVVKASEAPVFAPVSEDLLTPRLTGTSHLIHTAQASVARGPKDAQAYAALGSGYFQHARETGDVSDYQFAEESLSKSLDLVSADFSADTALETMAEVCMGEHRFTDALRFAQKALSLGTGDLSPFAIVGDAYADMGDYDKSRIAYGRLTPPDMTLGPRAAYMRDSRLSYLKFIAGDTHAAISMMKVAVTEGVEAQLPSENLAWLYYELGEYETQAGDAASADAAYLAALTTHPGDYRVLAALGKLRANYGHYEEAISLYQKAIAVVPMPIFVAELGDLYARTGNLAEAQKQYALVEYIGLLGRINQVLHNRDLALFYADHDMKLTESLDLARKELEVRHDIYTWDALAWALYKNGKLAEAAKASDKALQFGTRDSLILFHAGLIAEGQGESEQARSELKQALRINPHFHLIYADSAQKKLDALEAHMEPKGGSNGNAR